MSAPQQGGKNRLNPRALNSGASLRGGDTFSDSVKAFLNLMIEGDEAPSVKRVVAAAGMSARTFQRQLKEEGASFSDLLADVRRSETLKRLREHNLTIAAIANDLGYSDQATFTRAFRRWTGVPQVGSAQRRVEVWARSSLSFHFRTAAGRGTRPAHDQP